MRGSEGIQEPAGAEAKLADTRCRGLRADGLEERRAKGKSDVALLPLPTGPENLPRLRRLFRYDIYQRHYPEAPGTGGYLASMRARLAENPRWFDEELVRIAAALAATPRYVYGSRDRRFAVDAMAALLADRDEAPPADAQAQADAD